MLGGIVRADKQAAHLDEVAHLGEAGHQRKKQADAEAEPDERRVPNYIIEPEDGGLDGAWFLLHDYLQKNGRPMYNAARVAVSKKLNGRQANIHAGTVIMR